MTPAEIESTYGPFPHEAIPEILRAASEALDTPTAAGGWPKTEELIRLVRWITLGRGLFLLALCPIFDAGL
jgi:hypothetical protein